MAGSVASGVPAVVTQSLNLSASHHRQVSTLGVHVAAVNPLLKEKSPLGHTLPTTISKRKAPSTFVSSEVMWSPTHDPVLFLSSKISTGSETNDGGGDSGNGNKMKHSSVLHRRELLGAAAGTLCYASSAGRVQSSTIQPKVLTKDGSSSFLLTRREPSEDEVRAHSDEGLTADDLEEVLLVKGVKVPTHTYMSFSVFINLPNADTRTPLDIQEFIGQITNIPNQSSPDHRVNFRLDIGASVRSLNLPPDESVAVTFVPRGMEEDVPFDGVETEWL